MPAPPQRRSPFVLLLVVAAPVVGAGGIVFGLIWLGWLAKQHLGTSNQIEFAAIECDAPPGLSREEFLGEVQYLAERDGQPLPDRLDPNDDLVKRLLAAFVRHPWVTEVTEIKVLPEQRLRVGCRFRAPVLAVEQDGKMRAVDEHGVRLPDTAPTDGLPVLHHALPPRGPAGTVWGDDRVTAAAQAAARERAQSLSEPEA